MQTTTAQARALLLHVIEEFVPWSLELDNLTDDQVVCTVAEIARERRLKLPGLERAVAALMGVSE